MENTKTKEKCSTFSLLYYKFEYIVPIVSDTKFSVKLPRVKAEKWHKLSRVPKVC